MCVFKMLDTRVQAPLQSTGHGWLALEDLPVDFGELIEAGTNSNSVIEKTQDNLPFDRTLSFFFRNLCMCVCIRNCPLAPRWGFSGPMINKYSSKHDKVKNPNWREADQLAIYKRSREVELGATENNVS